MTGAEGGESSGERGRIAVSPPQAFSRPPRFALQCCLLVMLPEPVVGGDLSWLSQRGLMTPGQSPRHPHRHPVDPASPAHSAHINRQWWLVTVSDLQRAELRQSEFYDSCSGAEARASRRGPVEHPRHVSGLRRPRHRGPGPCGEGGQCCGGGSARGATGPTGSVREVTDGPAGRV